MPATTNTTHPPPTLEVGAPITNEHLAYALSRLFWIVTQGAGIARYDRDVQFFTDLSIASGLVPDVEAARKLADGYKKRG